MELMSNHNKEDNINANKEYEYTILPRHTYSENNAKRFKSTFDKCLDNETDEFISCEMAGLKITSLKQRCNEALLWLINNDIKGSKHNKEEYKYFRSKIKFKAVTYGGKEGVIVSWFTSALHSKSLTREIKSIHSISTKNKFNLLSSKDQDKDQDNKDNKIHWKERILSFIGDDNIRVLDLQGDDFQGNLLTDIDTEWIINTLTSAGIEYEIGANKIVAIKE